MTIFVRDLGRNVTGRETASNKQTASKSCALSIVRQLYHLGVIDAFSGTLKKDRYLSFIIDEYTNKKRCISRNIQIYTKKYTNK